MTVQPSVFCRTGLVCAVLVFPLASTVTGQTRRTEHAAYLNAVAAGPDFHVQGEYVGLVGNTLPIAAQVVALGGGQFDGVLYSGGLPGAGWDKEIRYAFRGRTEQGEPRFVGAHGERLAFDNPNFSARLDGGDLSGTARMFLNRVPDSSFVLRKVNRRSPSLGAPPPSGATVLFDGDDVEEWLEAKLVERNLLDRGTTTRRKFGNHFIHLEFRCPFMPTARGMRRGNSGVYVQSTWEIQIVDSFGWNRDNRKFERLSALGRCGGIAEMTAPRTNASSPPLAWQTFDIEFSTATFGPDSQTRPATLTVHHNGVLIHDHVVLPPAPPEESKPPPRAAAGLPGPLYLQDHGDPVHFRNIWVVER